jgi:hypothetical protein
LVLVPAPAPASAPAPALGTGSGPIGDSTLVTDVSIELGEDVYTISSVKADSIEESMKLLAAQVCIVKIIELQAFLVVKTIHRHFESDHLYKADENEDERRLSETQQILFFFFK